MNTVTKAFFWGVFAPGAQICYFKRGTAFVPAVFASRQEARVFRLKNAKEGTVRKVTITQA